MEKSPIFHDKLRPIFPDEWHWRWRWGQAVLPYDENVKRVRKYLLNSMIKTARTPNIVTIMRELNLTHDAVLESFRILQRGGALTMDPYTENIRTSPPFSNVPNKDEIEIEGEGEKKWYAEGALEALAVASLFPGKEVTTHSYCHHCYEPITIKNKDGKILSMEPSTVVIHIGVPFRRWGDIPAHTGEQMSFFSSEEHVEEWEREHPEYEGAIFSVDDLQSMMGELGKQRLTDNLAPLTPDSLVEGGIREMGKSKGDFWKIPG